MVRQLVSYTNNQRPNFCWMHFLKSGFFKNGIHVIINLLHFFNVIFYIINIEILYLILLLVHFPSFFHLLDYPKTSLYGWWQILLFHFTPNDQGLRHCNDVTTLRVHRALVYSSTECHVDILGSFGEGRLEAGWPGWPGGQAPRKEKGLTWVDQFHDSFRKFRHHRNDTNDTWKYFWP